MGLTALDVAGRGWLSREDMERMLPEMGVAPSPEQLDEIIAALDSDHDGRIRSCPARNSYFNPNPSYAFPPSRLRVHYSYSHSHSYSYGYSYSYSY